jgi:hypothetical protein
MQTRRALARPLPDSAIYGSVLARSLAIDVIPVPTRSHFAMVREFDEPVVAVSMGVDTR